MTRNGKFIPPIYGDDWGWFMTYAGVKPANLPLSLLEKCNSTRDFLTRKALSKTHRFRHGLTKRVKKKTHLKSMVFSNKHGIFQKKIIRFHSNNKTWYAAMNSPWFYVWIWLLRAAWIDHWPSALPKCAQHKANLRPFRMVFGILNIITWGPITCPHWIDFRDILKEIPFFHPSNEEYSFFQIQISGISHESCPHF